MKTMKMIKSYSSLKPAVRQIVKPDLKNHKRYEANFAVFKTLYPALKDTMHRMNENKK